MKKIKILFLGHYPIDDIRPANIIYRNKNQHPASWIKEITDMIASCEKFEVNLITATSYIKENIKFTYKNISFNVLRNPYSIPFSLRCLPSFLHLDKLTQYYFVLSKIRGKIKEIKPDIIYSFGTESFYSLAPINIKIPNIVHIQGPITEYFKHSKLFLLRTQIPFERKVIKNNLYFFTRTEFDYNFVKSINPQAKIFKVWEPIRNVFFNFNWDYNNSNNDDLIELLYVGMMMKSLKNPEITLRSISILRNKYPNIKLNIIGHTSISYFNYLQSLIYKLNINEQVNFLGFKNDVEIAKALSKARIFILESKCENSPNSLAEAMVVGTPVIASAVGGITSMIEHGRTGLLFDNTVEDLTEKIELLLNNTDYAKNLSLNEKRIARERHSSENVKKQTLDAIDLILNNH